jgi:RNA polymerase sigma factor (sigma-70 family)
VDDDESFRTALSRLLRAAGYEAREYASATQFLSAERTRESGCILLDVRMPGANGLDMQEELALKGNRLPIVFLTGYADVTTSVRALKAGAVDFLTKPVRKEALLDAIDTALRIAGDRHDKQSRLQVLRAAHETLTAREREVYEHVVAGKPNKQIGRELGISERTVKAHRGKVMGKMGVGSLVELVRAADLLVAGDGSRASVSTR